MRQFGLLVIVIVAAVVSLGQCQQPTSRSASDVMVDIYQSCLSQYSTSCIKPKALSWLSSVVQNQEIRITDDLSIIKTGSDDSINFQQQQRSNNGGIDARIQLFDKIDSFLSSHSIRINPPQILKTEEARAFVSDDIDLNNSLELPLAEGNSVEGRGFVKKVMIPFLLGLKFKTTVLLPLAFALIALKTWKATTLGLLSMVLSAAMVIFKFAKPKVVNYEVVHYPHAHHVEHHIDHPHHIDHLHHVDHPPPGWEPHGWARQLSDDAQSMAYGSQ